MTAVNVTGAGKVLRAFVGARVQRLVYVSSVTKVGASEDGHPVNKHQRCNLGRLGLDEVYDHSKVEAEYLVLNCANREVDSMVINPVGLLGSMDGTTDMGL